MDADVVQRLQMARYTFELGFLELSKGTDLGANQSVLQFHDAVETLLVTIADHVGVAQRRVEYHKYPTEITKSGRSLLHAKVLDEINDLRVPAKHRGRYVTQAMVQPIANRIKLFLQDNVRLFFGLPLDEISSADVIQSPRVRDEVKLAERAITSNNYHEALVHLVVSFRWLLEEARRAVPRLAQRWVEIPEELFDRSDLDRVRRELRSDELDSLFRRANERYEDLREQMQFVLFGVDAVAHARFRYITPQVNISYSGQREILWFNDSPLIVHLKNVRFCMHFVLETAVRLESMLRVSDAGNFYRLRLKKSTPYETYIEGVLKTVGTLPAGKELSGKYTRGIDGVHDSWMVMIEDQRVFVPLNACDVLAEEIGE